MSYWVYLLRCRDGSLYTGSTSDVERRLRVHQSGKGAKYTRSRLPVELVYREALPDRSAALRREAAIKKLGRQEKLCLIAGMEPDVPGVSDASGAAADPPEKGAEHVAAAAAGCTSGEFTQMSE